MQITFVKHSALKVMRSLRLKQGNVGALRCRSGILPADPSPRKRWTNRLLHELDPGCDYADENGEIWVAVSQGAKRVRTRGAHCTTFERGIPEGSFLQVADGIAISSPELLFAELAAHLHPVELLVLGYEMCGTYSLDAADPFNGPVSYGLKPLTSAKRIREFVAQARGIHGIAVARKVAAYLADNAWSPAEALIAAVLCLPVDYLGYDLGALVLNPRVGKGCALPGARDSRVPDIVMSGTSTGINYDGKEHLDLDSLVRAAVDVGMNPGAVQNQVALQQAMRAVRSKIVDDIRRNRELALSGYSVLPMVMEDLYVRGGMDAMAALLISAIEQRDKRDLSRQRRHLGKRALSDARYRMMLSLLPGNHPRHVKVGRFIQGFKVDETSWEPEERVITW